MARRPSCTAVREAGRATRGSMHAECRSSASCGDPARAAPQRTGGKGHASDQVGSAHPLRRSVQPPPDTPEEASEATLRGCSTASLARQEQRGQARSSRDEIDRLQASSRRPECPVASARTAVRPGGEACSLLEPRTDRVPPQRLSFTDEMFENQQRSRIPAASHPRQTSRRSTRRRQPV